MRPVAMILVIVVPRYPASTAPSRGVQVLFKLKAAMSRLNSVFDVPISIESRVLSGPRIYDALTVNQRPQEYRNTCRHLLMATDT